MENNYSKQTIKIILDQTEPMLEQMQKIINGRIKVIDERRINLLPFKKAYLEYFKETEHEYYNFTKLRTLLYQVKEYHHNIIATLDNKKELNEKNLKYKGGVTYKYNNN